MLEALIELWNFVSNLPGAKRPRDKHWGFQILWTIWIGFWLALFALFAVALVFYAKDLLEG